MWWTIAGVVWVGGVVLQLCCGCLGRVCGVTAVLWVFG